MSDTRSFTAYRVVANALRRRIMEGDFRPGEQIPTEQQLCDQFAASRITIRRALQILADERLIERRQGSGTFVNSVAARKIPLLSTDFSGSVARFAPDLDRAVESWGWQVPTPEIAGVLRIAPGESVLFARRLDLLTGRAVAYDEIHLVRASADRLTESDLAELRFLERWQHVQGVRLTHLTQAIEAQAAERPITGFIDLRRGAPVLKETDVIFDSSDQPMGLFISYYRPDTFRLTSTVRLEIGPAGDEKL